MIDWPPNWSTPRPNFAFATIFKHLSRSLAPAQHQLAVQCDVAMLTALDQSHRQQLFRSAAFIALSAEASGSKLTEPINAALYHLLAEARTALSGTERRKTMAPLRFGATGALLDTSSNQTSALRARGPLIVDSSDGSVLLRAGRLRHDQVCRRVNDRVDGGAVVVIREHVLAPESECSLHDKVRRALDIGLGGFFVESVLFDDARGTCYGRPFPQLGIVGNSRHRSPADCNDDEASSDDSAESTTVHDLSDDDETIDYDLYD